MFLAGCCVTRHLDTYNYPEKLTERGKQCESGYEKYQDYFSLWAAVFFVILLPVCLFVLLFTLFLMDVIMLELLNFPLTPIRQSVLIK